MTSTALLTGASGLVGSHLLRRLLDGGRYDRVFTLGRRRLDVEHPRLEQIVLDPDPHTGQAFDRLPELEGFPAADDAFCCLGTTIAQAGSEEAFRQVDFHYVRTYAETAVRHGATQFLVISAMGADPASRIFYNRVKGEMERAVAALPFEAVQIFRPALLLGERDETRVAESAAAVLFRAVNPILVGPLRPYRAIAAKTVAAAMAEIAALRPLGVNVYESDEIGDLAAAIPAG